MTIILATGNHNKIREFKAILQEQIEGLSQTPQDSINVYAYSDFVTPFEIEENGTSFKENAKIKLKAVYNAFCNKMRDDMEVKDSVWNGLHTPLVFIAEDSGLSVPMLDNEPGIYSARYYEFLQAQGQNLDNLAKLGNSADEANLVCLCEKLSGLVNKGQIQIPAFFTAYIALLIVPISATLDSKLDSMLPPFECLEVEYSKGVLHGKVIDKPRGKEGFGYDPIFIPTQSNPQKQTLAEFSLSAKNAISHRKKAFLQCINQLFFIQK
ncbi:non-canonical purine NTP pyrophosphatase [Helicobacter cinaedi]|uniref:non-canonical purine NTP pyrophosphatase n=1 Tax=Helicobacter cinaedi TaxID=213 RepID=UPI000CF0C6ED|nr:non-canonical purine NTP pyrophosphatase [Helicobacter cinaedi]